MGLLNVLNESMANAKYFGKMQPNPVKCLVNVVDKNVMPCSVSNDL